MPHIIPPDIMPSIIIAERAQNVSERLPRNRLGRERDEVDRMARFAPAGNWHKLRRFFRLPFLRASRKVSALDRASSLKRKGNPRKWSRQLGDSRQFANTLILNASNLRRAGDGPKVLISNG